MNAPTKTVAWQTFWVAEGWTVRGILAAAFVLPVIYSLVIPFFLVDCWVQAYQAVCFRLLSIASVRRREYVVLDRHRLAYLTALQRVNCLYCGYVNGVIAFSREVAARTEQFWCPIQHRRRPRGQHTRKARFAPYGDATAFQRMLPQLRKELGGRRPGAKKRTPARKIPLVHG